MIGLFRARADVRAVHAVIDHVMPHIKKGRPSDRVADVIVELQMRALKAQQEAERLRRTYEPNRRRVEIEGVTVVQPVGGTTFRAAGGLA